MAGRCTIVPAIKTDTGGIQSVIADDPSDNEQVELVHGNLQSEADRSTGGDYTDPASIHGPDMPGLTELADTTRSP